MHQTTIIVSAWNAEATIGRSLASAADQDSAEIVVADDASSDGTAAEARRRGADRVLTTGVNGGPSAARNRALAVATGTWVAILDSDDSFTPGAIARLRAVAESSGADVVLGNVQRVDPGGRPIETGSYLPLPADAAPRTVTLDDFLASNHGEAGGRTMGYLKPLFRRAFLDRHGLRYDETLRNGEDAHIILECLAVGGRVVIAPRADYLYTVREGSISHRVDPSHLRALVAADDALVERHVSVLTARHLALFAARRRALTEMAESEAILRALKHRRPGEAARGLWNHPPAGRRVLRQLLEALSNRLDVLRGGTHHPHRRSGR